MALAMAMVALSYADRACMAAAAPFLSTALRLTKVQLGLAFTAFSIGYSAFEAAAGRVADGVGAVRALRRIVIGWSLMTAATGAAMGVMSLIAVRFVFGACEAGTYPTLARLYDEQLGPRARGRGFGGAMTIATVSGALSQPLTVFMVKHLGWRWTFAVLGLFGAVWTLLWSTATRGGAPRDGRAVQAEVHMSVPWRQILRHRALWHHSVSYAATLYGLYLFQTWFPTYLLSSGVVRGSAVGWLSAIAAGGLAAGIMAGGYADDRLSTAGLARVAAPLSATALVLAGSCVGLAALAHDPGTIVSLFAFSGLTAGLTVAHTWTSCASLEPQAVGAVCGVLNTFGNVGGAVTGISIGLMADRTGSWRLPLASVVVAYAIAACAWLTGPRASKALARPVQLMAPEQGV